MFILDQAHIMCYQCIFIAYWYKKELIQCIIVHVPQFLNCHIIHSFGLQDCIHVLVTQEPILPFYHSLGSLGAYPCRMKIKLSCTVASSKKNVANTDFNSVILSRIYIKIQCNVHCFIFFCAQLLLFCFYYYYYHHFISFYFKLQSKLSWRPIL